MDFSGSFKGWDRWHIIPQLAVYTIYIPFIYTYGAILIYCLLGGYIIPTTLYNLYRNLKNPLIKTLHIYTPEN